MKRFALVVFFITIVLSVSVANAQVSWQLKAHSMDTAVFQGEMQMMVNQGWTPVGLSQHGMNMYVLYLGGDPFGMAAWHLKWYHDLGTLENNITQMMNAGYIPMGISYAGDVFFAIYIQAQNSTATAWQLVPSAANMNSVQSAISPYTGQYYLPCGITQYGNEFYTLLVQIPDTTAKSWEIEQYVANDAVVQSSINNALNSGKAPWGFTYTGNLFTALYVGF